MAIFKDLCFKCNPPSPKPRVKRCKGSGSGGCGAMDGARILLGSKKVTAELKKAKAHLQGVVVGYAGNELLNINKNIGVGVCVHRSVFSEYFPPSVSAYDIEDILCIYKDSFALGGTKAGCPFPDIAAIVAHYKSKKHAQPANPLPQQVNPSPRPANP